jgi:hypothetical protein
MNEDSTQNETPTIDPSLVRASVAAGEQRSREEYRPTGYDYALAIPEGVAQGAQGLGSSLVGLASDVSGSVGLPEFYNREAQRAVSEDLRPTTTLGAIVKGITQFSIGQAAVGGLGAAAGIGRAATGAGRAGQWLGKMALTDYLSFSGDEGRLADLLRQYPSLKNRFVDWLATDPNDPWWEARLKNSIEGAFVGTVSHLALGALGKGMGALVGKIVGKPGAEDQLTEWAKHLADPDVSEAVFTHPESDAFRARVKAVAPQLSDDEINPVLAFWAKMAKNTGRDYGDTLQQYGQVADLASLPDDPRLMFQKTIADAKAYQLNEGEPIRPTESGSPTATEPVPVAENSPAELKADELPIRIDTDVQPESPPVHQPDVSAMVIPPANWTDEVKGAVKLFGDTNALMYLGQHSDFSTLVHESFHIWRNLGLPAEVLTPLEKAYGVAGGQWTREAEEKAARDFERYLYDGGTKNGSIASAFAKAKQFMEGIYKTLAGSPLEDNLSPDVRHSFDTLFGDRPLTVRGAASETAELLPEGASTANRILTQEAKPAIPAETRQQIQEMAEDRLTKGQSIESMLNDIHTTFNGPRSGLTGDPLKVAEEMHKILDPLISKKIGGVEHLTDFAAQAYQQATVIGQDPLKLSDFIYKTLSKAPEQLRQFRMQMGIARVLYKANIDQMSTLAQKMLDGSAGDYTAAREQLKHLAHNAMMLQFGDIAVSAEGARFPGVRRIIPAGDLDLSRVMSAIDGQLSNPQSGTAQRLLGDLAMANGDPLRTASVLDQYGRYLGNKALSVINEVRRNALISGLSTPGTKILSDALQTASKPVERLIGGAVMKLAGLAGGDEAMFHARTQFATMGEKALDVFSNAKQMADMPLSPASSAARSFVEGVHTLEHGGEFEPRYAISSANLGLDPDATIGKAVDWIGKVVNIPQRAMVGITDYFQQLGYQSYVLADAAIEARNKGITEPALLQSFANSKLKAAFGESGEATNPSALRFAQQTTSAAPLGQFGSDVSRLLNRNPWTQLIVPFFKTPMNLFKTFTEYTPPLYMMQQSFWDGLRSTIPAVKAETLGRLAVGATFWTAAMYAAMSGSITGEGPTDPHLRATMMTAGWRPHSIAFDNEDGTKTYVDYRKIEPYAAVLSVAGDLAETWHLMQDGEREGVAAAATMAVAKNLVSKTYLTGLGDFIDMLRQPDHSMPKFLGNFSGSFVPRLLMNLDPDQDMRQVKGYLDGIKARLPGYAEDLPPVRNAFGEPVMASGPSFLPIRWSTTPNDVVSKELMQYEKGLPQAPRRMAGLDLSQFLNEKGQTAADRYQELIGQTQVNGRSLRDSLGKLFQSQWYQQQAPVQDANDITNPRVKAVQQMFMNYHEAAKPQLLKEFPQIIGTLQGMRKSQAAQGRSLSPVMNF